MMKVAHGKQRGWAASVAGGFTLIEIMVVVAIMGLILAAGIPSLYGFFHKEGLRKSMSDILDTCRSARAQAIMSGKDAILVIHPKDGTMEVAGGSGGGYGAWAHSAKLEGARIEALMINNNRKVDLAQADEVDVRFFRNGMCEEMVLVLMSEKNEMRGVSLDLMTGLPILLSQEDIMSLGR